MTFDVDVLVAGGGTVGLATAAALAEAGFAVTLIERGAAPQPFEGGEVDPRVYALAPASVRLLDRLGVWHAIREARASPYVGMQVWQQRVEEALRFDALPDEPLGWIVEHGLLNAALWAQRGGWRRRIGTTIVDVQADAEGASVALAGGERLRARLLVIADGPDSPLRESLGIDSLGWNYEQRAIVCHVVSERSHRGVARQRFLPTGPLALLPLADGRSSIVWSCAAPLAAELLALDDAAFALRLATASGQVLGAIGACTPRLSFPLRLKHVPAPVIDGAVVVGDAAHVVHPLAGQGVNLGLADADALAATLVAARDAGRGWWRVRTLQAYARHRSGDTLEMLAMTDGLHRAFGSGTRASDTLGFGLSLVNRVEPFKQWFASRAQG